MTERDNRRYDSLATNILGLDPSILSVLIVSVKTGSTLAEQARPELKENFGSISQRSNGMAGKWGILAFTSIERFKPKPSNAKYLLIVRDDYSGMIFPALIPEDAMLNLSIDAKAEAAKIYQLISEFLREESESSFAKKEHHLGHAIR